MKSNGLLSVLTFSDKRQTILFLLQESPKTLSEIKDYFHVKTPEILPRLKEMESSGLIIKEENYCYHLSKTGEVIAAKFKPFLDTIQAIDSNIDFWNDHELSAIPDDLLHRLDELKDCHVHEIDYSFESHPDFIKHVLESNTFKGVASIFIPTWPFMFLELAKEGVDIEIVVTKNVLDIINNRYPEMLEEGLSYPNAHMYLYKEKADIAFATTDVFLSLSLISNKNNMYDPCNDLMGFDPMALNWGEDLFTYYKNHSTELKSTHHSNQSIMKKIYPESMLVPL